MCLTGIEISDVHTVVNSTSITSLNEISQEFNGQVTEHENFSASPVTELISPAVTSGVLTAMGQANSVTSVDASSTALGNPTVDSATVADNSRSTVAMDSTCSSATQTLDNIDAINRLERNAFLAAVLRKRQTQQCKRRKKRKFGVRKFDGRIEYNASEGFVCCVCNYAEQSLKRFLRHVWRDIHVKNSHPLCAHRSIPGIKLPAGQCAIIHKLKTVLTQLKLFGDSKKNEVMATTNHQVTHETNPCEKGDSIASCDNTGIN